LARKKILDASDPKARDLLLSSALKLFTDKGYASTTVREIVADAGVTKPVLYYYFGNKEGIYLEILRGPFRRFQDILDNFPSSNLSAARQLEVLCEQSFEIIHENIGAAKLMNSIYYGPSQGAPYFDFETYHGKFIQTIRQLVEDGVYTGEFHKLDPDDATLAIVGAFHIVMDIMLCETRVITITRETISRVLKIIFEGILNKDRKGE
jgi:AcrR family transcriptional regulator